MSGSTHIQAGYRVVETFMDEMSRIGRRADGSFERLAWTPEDRAARELFAQTARDLGLRVEVDSATNLWAWLGEPGAGAVITGSHLDTVRGGGNYDGALGVATGLAALHSLRKTTQADRRPHAVVVFSDEEGARFNTPCFGSQILVGDLQLADVASRRDENGVSLRASLAEAGFEPDEVRGDLPRVNGLAAFIELHIEQGRQLAGQGRTQLGVATSIWPHGRWRVTLTGEANHAGTTDLTDRRDPMLAFSVLVSQTREQAINHGAIATVGRVLVEPNSTNTVPARVTAWLDCRAPQENVLADLVQRIELAIREVGKEEDVETTFVLESVNAGVSFSPHLNSQLHQALQYGGIPFAQLATAAGHDAGILAPHTATTMLFVRNETGNSHSAAEFASDDDCRAGYEGLTRVLEELTP